MGSEAAWGVPVTEDKGIPIRNVYYMMAYAFRCPEIGEFEDLATEEFEHAHDLFEGNKKLPIGLFAAWSLGVSTNRDAWVWNYSQSALENNVKRPIESTNSQIEAAKGNPKEVIYDTKQYSWTAGMLKRVERDPRSPVASAEGRRSHYVPSGCDPPCRVNQHGSPRHEGFGGFGQGAARRFRQNWALGGFTEKGVAH